MSNVPPPQFSDNPKWCQIHAVSGYTCGGPHVVVRTDLGDEMLSPAENPVGTPISEMSEDERKKHMEAEANAQRDDSNPA